MNNLKYLKDFKEKEKENIFLNIEDKEKIYKNNELITILNTKFEEQKINQSLYVGQKLRNISVTNLLQCSRLVTYNRLGYKPNIDKAKKYPYAYLMTEVGNYIHDKLANLLGINNITKMLFKHKDYPINGKVDGILYNSLIEFKTISNEEFLTINQPRPKDVIQTRILYDICKYSNNYKDIDIIKILYFSRNLKDVCEFNIHIDDIKNRNIVQEYYNKGLNIYNCLEKNVLDESYSNEDCNFCLYSNYCKYCNLPLKNETDNTIQNKKQDTKELNNDNIINDFFNDIENIDDKKDNNIIRKINNVNITNEDDDIKWL